MILVVVLLIVGSVSVVVARTIVRGIGHRQLVESDLGASSPSHRTVTAAMTMASLTVGIFVPLFLVAYVAIGLMRHALGQ